MNHYLLVDKHNEFKAHHISITDDGEMFYNQAINMKRHADTKLAVANNPEWYDFYEKDEPVNINGSHGYQEYIKKAYIQWNKDRPLEVGDGFDHYFNQADREVEIIGVLDNEAFGHYEMPNGRVFIGIFERDTKNWKRSQAFKTIPKKWLGVIDSVDIEYLAQQN